MRSWLGTSLEVRFSPRLGGGATQAQQEHLAEDSHNYQLEGAMVKGMRPLYKAIPSQKMVLVRPFRDKEAALRPYLRYYQWSQIWGSQEEPTEAILPDLQQRAIEEAKGLEPISPAMLRTKFQCLPEKAPGVSGWSNRMLKQLPHGALLPLTQLLTEMERTGRLPGQWRVVKFAMLAKKADIERPIGLCDVVYKAWLQVRFSLVTAWMKKYAAVAPWDAARPGNTCLSVSIHRLFQAELAKVNHQCRVTLFLDLSTFYETISHAYELEYPATLLNIAVQIYRGARVLTADSGHSPATYSSRGVVAGCPIAPSLSKLALHSPCAEVFRSGLVSNLDIYWGFHCCYFWPPRARTCPEKDESFAGGGRSTLRQVLLWFP